MLSRLQFAVATLFHFLFVPLTMGLSVLIAIMETKYARTKDEDYRNMARFWGKIFLINFAVGVVTGITLEFQFGTNWSRYSQYVGDVFGSLLAIEATLAFFLESTFVAVWLFTWNRFSPRGHAVTIWLVAFASNLSALWILMANAWMQHPVGYTLRNGRAELTDFLALVTQSFAIQQFVHTVSAAFVLSGFVVMGVSAYHLLKRNKVQLFQKSFRLSLLFTLISCVVVVAQGHAHGAEVAEVQPTKLAAMESHWETQTNAPIYLFAIPDEENEGNFVEILPLPGALSMLAFHSPSAEVKGLKEWSKEDRPPVLVSFLSFRLMVGLGFLFLFLTVVGWFLRNNLLAYPLYLKIMIFAVPLPYLACEAGWILAEVGRQPWIVYGLMRTRDAVSPIATSQVATSLIAFLLVYGLLGLAGFYLMFKVIRKGPESSKDAEEVGGSNNA